MKRFPSSQKLVAVSFVALAGILAADGFVAWLALTSFQKVGETRQAIAAAQIAGGRLGKVRTVWQEVEQQSRRLQETLITRDSLPVLLGELERLGEEEGILLDLNETSCRSFSEKPKAGADEEQKNELCLSLKASGTFGQVMRFFVRLENSPLFLVVDEGAFRAGGERNAAISGQFTIRVLQKPF